MRIFLTGIFWSLLLVGCMQSSEPKGPVRNGAAVNVGNKIPTAQSQIITMNEDGSQLVDLAASDPDGDELTFSVTSPRNGTLTGTPPRLTYSPNVGFYGEDVFSFTVSDGFSQITRTVLFDVRHVNHAPVTSAQSITLKEDGSFSWELLASDRDRNDTMTYHLVTPPANGMLLGTPPKMTYTPNAGFFGEDRFSFKVRDGVLESNTSVVSIMVEHVNHAPVSTSLAIALNEDGTKAFTLNASDRDVGDVLSYVIVSNPSHGTLSGTAPNLVYTPTAGYFGTDSFTFKARDGFLDSNVSTVSIVISHVNHAPVSVGQAVVLNEDQSKAIVLSASDRDVGDVLSYVIVANPSQGTLSGTAPNLVYQPRSGFFGTDSFTFKARDGALDSNVSTVTLTVNHVNHAPVANAQNVSLNEDSSKAIVLTANDSDRGDTLRYSVVTGPTKGTLSGTAPNLTYTPNAGYFGNDSFTFKANDSALDSNVATVSITVMSINHAPVSVGQAVVLNEDQPKSIVISASDRDEGDVLSYVIVANPIHGALSGTAPNLVYTPTSGYFGTDSFTFKARDGALDSNVSTVSLTVNDVNQAPVSTSLAIALNEDGTKAFTLNASDRDVGDVLSYVIVSNPAHGTLSGTAPNLVYTPNTGYFGTDSFTFKARDGFLDSNVSTVSIVISHVNHAPVSAGQAVVLNEDESKAIVLSASDRDVGDVLSYVIVANPSQGTLSGTAPNLVYQPRSGYHGSDSFTFRARDGALDSNVSTVSLTVNRVNHAPVANAQNVSLNEDSSKAIVLTANDSDTGDTLRYSVVTAPTKGTLTGTAPNLTYTPNAGYFGNDSFTFKANDSALDSNVATVSITVMRINRAPVAQSAMFGLNQNGFFDLRLSAVDSNNDNLSFRVTVAPANGVLSGTPPNLTYRPNNSFFGVDSFQFKANDGRVDSNEATITLMVQRQNSAPTANPHSFSVDMNGLFPVTLSGSDANGDALTYRITSGPSRGQISGTGPVFTYRPTTGYVGPDSFRFVVNDGLLDSATAEVQITVRPVDVVTTKGVGVLFSVGYTWAFKDVRPGSKLFSMNDALLSFNSTSAVSANPIYFFPTVTPADEQGNPAYYCFFNPAVYNDNPEFQSLPASDRLRMEICNPTSRRAAARRQAKWLRDAGIDFIVIDNTNAWEYFKNGNPHEYSTEITYFGAIEGLLKEWRQLRDDYLNGLTTIDPPKVAIWGVMGRVINTDLCPKIPNTQIPDTNSPLCRDSDIDVQPRAGNVSGYYYRRMLNRIYGNPAYQDLLFRHNGKKVFFYVDPEEQESRSPVPSRLAEVANYRTNVNGVLDQGITLVPIWHHTKADGTINTQATHRWAFQSSCTVPGNVTRPTTSMVNAVPCKQFVSSTSPIGKAITVTPSYQIPGALSSQVWGSPGRLGGLTLRKMFDTVFAEQPDYVFLSSWNELGSAGLSLPQIGPAMGMGDHHAQDPRTVSPNTFQNNIEPSVGTFGAAFKDHHFVDGYAAEFSRDIEPSIASDYGTSTYDLLSALIRLYKNNGQYGVTTCDVAREPRCAKNYDFVNVASLVQQDAAGNIIRHDVATNPTEMSPLLAAGFRPVCANRFQSDFCSENYNDPAVCAANGVSAANCAAWFKTRAANSPFIAYRETKANAADVIPLYRCYNSYNQGGTDGRHYFLEVNPNICRSAPYSLSPEAPVAYLSRKRTSEMTRTLRRCDGPGVMHSIAVDALCPYGNPAGYVMGYVH